MTTLLSVWGLKPRLGMIEGAGVMPLSFLDGKRIDR